VADRKHGMQPPQTDTAIHSKEWDRLELTGDSFERVAFIDVDMSELENIGATFVECTRDRP
jgi:fluoroquinolone resistance protein